MRTREEKSIGFCFKATTAALKLFDELEVLQIFCLNYNDDARSDNQSKSKSTFLSMKK